MEPPSVLRSRGGVMPTRELRDASGLTRSAVDGLVRSGALIRPSNGWIALPSADPMLLSAAQIGVVVSCVTLAARRGLWDVRAPHVHVAAHPHRALRRATSAKVHWARPRMPRNPGALEDSLENALELVAECQPFESALAVWESALNRGLVTVEHLRTFPFGARARRIRAETQPFSDSGLESVVVPRLRWLDLELRRQAWILGHRVDLLIGDRLVLQIDGGHHVDAQRMSDNEHDALLRLAGYHVIRVGYAQVMSDWPSAQALVVGAVARGLHLARSA